MNQTLQKIVISTSILFFISGCNEKNETVKVQEKTIIKNTTAKQTVVEAALENISEKKEKISIITVPKKPVAYSEQSLQKISTVANKQNIKNFDFDLLKKGFKDNNTLLIVGGIQGDEPGGFISASLIDTHYEITKGSVWIVPNLNFYSIIQRSRAPYGDMNRKFAKLSVDDPDYKSVQRIKKYISDEQVKLVLNLHDGSGFYRPMYIDRWHQPLTWGQSSVIDQEILHDVKYYSDTYSISEEVVKHSNNFLLKAEDIYRTKNTHTRFNKTHEEQEMGKTLTYFAVTHGKAAFGHETSKSLNVPQRVYYKLLAIEKYMDIMGIKYKRNFPLTLAGVNSAINNDLSVKFNGTKITLPLDNIRKFQKYFPVDKNGVITYEPSNALIKVIQKNNVYSIYYGNRRVTQLVADYKTHLNLDSKITMTIDNKTQMVNLGDTIKVSKNFEVVDEKQFRVNVIGYTNKSGIETDTKIAKKMFIPRHSIDTDGNIYRIEFYKGKD
ncbi:MAG: M99 family carboxypeptidase catalytic domain-containing protein, partial [Arcobacteraceae bacterium]